MRKFLIFRLGEQLFGIDIFSVVEIINPQKFTIIPEAPEYVPGVINLRGEAITVVDMRRRLSLQSQPAKERVVIIRMPEEKIGLLVDEVIGIKEVDEKRLRKPSRLYRGLRAKFIEGLIEEGKDRVIIVLNMDSIVTEVEGLSVVSPED